MKLDQYYADKAGSCTLLLPIKSNPSTFPIENVKLRRTITPVYLFISDQKFSEQLQCLKKSLNLSVTFFVERNELSMNLEETFGKFQKSIPESPGFSFSKLFADDPS